MNDWSKKNTKEAGITTLTPRNKDALCFAILLSSRIVMLLMNRKPTEILVHRLSMIAIQKYNGENKTNLELVRAVKANRKYGAGFIFYITFEAKDANSHTDPITFQAAVRYLPGIVTVYRVHPKP
ncbi:Cystatin domain [Arabidopsis suecica]|uniref:Cystatin domain n=1 Tax=Arabidopsis suecica TaxID=45249 RepID=A0A8T2HDS0_ARASU|nr:Cystatin domain [Arabidopsis suecica]